MAFIKAAWRFIMGVKDVLVLAFLLLFFGVLYVALRMMPGDAPARTGAGALLIDLDGVVVEQPAQDDPFALLSAEEGVREYRLRDIVVAIEAARTDPNVKAIVLDLDGFMGGGQVALGEIGRALDGVRAAKKPVLAFATAYEDDAYRLAAHASEIWINPIGGVALLGPGGSRLYYKGLLDRLGVTAHIYRVGTYKSAVEPFLLGGMSDEARAAAQALAAAMWDTWQADVKRVRPAAKLVAYADDPVAVARASGGDMAKGAQAAGLVDRIGDADAFEVRVAELAGEGGEEDGPAFAAIDMDTYVRAKAPANDGAIGVLTIAGEIADGESGPGTAGGDSIAALLRDTLAKRTLKALVVRIDSPGGSVLASEKIRAEIARARDAGIPVVASMGSVAASGGYWVATPAARILAEPATITGSIGVFGIVPSFEGTLAKIGITSDGVATTPLSGEPDLAGGVSDEFNALAQLGVEDIYRRFVGLVARARGMTPEQVDRIAQGRVWDGGTARQLRLVDRFGDLNDAIAEAAKLAKVDPATARPYYIEPEVSGFAMLLRDMAGGHAKAARRPGGDMLMRAAWRREAVLVQAFADARMLARGGGVRVDCLECRGFGALRLPRRAGPYRDTDLTALMVRAMAR